METRVNKYDKGSFHLNWIEVFGPTNYKIFSLLPSYADMNVININKRKKKHEKLDDVINI